MHSLSLLSQAAVALAASPFAGVNIAGFDFGVDIDGKANLTASFGPVLSIGKGNVDGAGQMQHFVQADGLNTFRLPVSWQFLINSNNLNGSAINGPDPTVLPTSDGQLSAASAAQYDELVQACLATGSYCIVDIHNYARFEGQIIGQGGPTNDQFASLWSQIAAMYKDESRVMFGVMNEPHHLPDLPMWADTVQAAVTAIRMAGAMTQMILLPGTNFTGAQQFIDNGSAGNLSRVHNLDGTNTSLIFDVHKYLDTDGSGTHLECISDHVDDSFRPLAEFLVANGRKAILSETGGGNSSSCLKFLCNELAFINANPDTFIGYTAWSAGAFSPVDYNLAMTPWGSMGNFTDQETVRQCVVGTRSDTLPGVSPPRGNSTTGGCPNSTAAWPAKPTVTTAATAKLEVSKSITWLGLGIVLGSVALCM